MTIDAPVLTLLLGLAALLYSSVGHGGASAYLAVLALAGTATAVMRPTALLLNLVVAGLGTIQFARAGHFRWGLAWPFILAGIPMAYLGGLLSLPETVYRPVIGVILLLSAFRFMITLQAADAPRSTPSTAVRVAVGASLGFLAGVTGVGGGSSSHRCCCCSGGPISALPPRPRPSSSWSTRWPDWPGSFTAAAFCRTRPGPGSP